jgi:signal transduction histidine kinase
MEIKIDKLPAPDLVPGRIVALVVAEDLATQGAVREALTESNPNCEVIVASTLSEFRAAMQENAVDFVAFEMNKMRPEGVLPLYETKLFAQSIGTIVIADNLAPSEFDTIMRAGCDRIILKGESWLKELRNAIRQVIRVRKLENENTRLLGLLGARNSELNLKNSRLDEYSATVAHDIRGLVSNIVMRIEFALEMADGSLSKEIQEQFQNAANTGRRVVEIVKSSYELARLGADNQKLEMVNLRELLEEVRIDLGIDKDSSIALNISKLPTIPCNRGLMRRVFLNLLSNSIRYRRKETLILEIDSQSDSINSSYVISVRDNGLGISKEKQKNIFRPFWRGNRASVKHQGLGLGLSIVDRIISLHGGGITVRSKESEGTEFIITLPKEASPV